MLVSETRHCFRFVIRVFQQRHVNSRWWKSDRNRIWSNELFRERIKNYARVAEHDRTSAAYPLMNRRPTFQSYRRTRARKACYPIPPPVNRITASTFARTRICFPLWYMRLEQSDCDFHTGPRAKRCIYGLISFKKNLEIFFLFFFFFYISVAAARFIGIRDHCAIVISFKFFLAEFLSCLVFCIIIFIFISCWKNIGKYCM